MARQRNFAGMGASRRRLTEWVSLRANFSDFTSGQTKVVSSLSQAQLRDFVPCTIIRTVGLLVVAADTNFITNQTYSGAVGGCLVREDARISAVVPDAFENSGDDVWFWHQFFAAIIDDRADSDIVVSQNFMVDSKAQRKVVDGDALIFTAQGGGESDGFDLALYLRILLKLH